MRAVDRLSTVVVALAFVLAGLGAPGCANHHPPGATVTAAHAAAHVGEHGAAAAPHAPGDAPPELRTAFAGGPCGDHRAGVTVGDGPDDVLPAAPPRVGGTPERVAVTSTRGQPALPLPPRGTLATRGPPASA
ncbi:hypothetical protein GCE86_21510 [Micromonospora terminaliae]|uniref:Uncharacterized protein n=1 Tax=Micromonospora terminaliae TaxID=1914461 RepID=A0AAJ2ZJV1_9ACTN|nr:hypothetical protein [Micromonospora terminaliae]NES31147.1 hypothetical protein [Micromonospora terminaliae]QGL49371.1 hypothetical protein GCE86_21510 [Micromonospora terminaliae]